MPTSTVIFGPDSVKQLLDSINASIENDMKQAANILWSAFLSYLAAHWLAIMVVIFIIFAFVTVKAMMGRWGSLGSFLYNFFYFGILFVIGLIWGPDVFLGDFFKTACTIILYPVCYLITGYILKKTGVRK